MNDDMRSEVLERLQQIKYVGAAYAEQFYDDLDLRTYEDVVDAAEADRLVEVSGIGSARQDDIRESAEALLEARHEQQDLEEEAGDQEEAEPTPEETADGEVEEGDEEATDEEGSGTVDVRTVEREPEPEGDIGAEAVERAGGAVESAVEAAEDEVEDEKTEEAVESDEEDVPRPRIDRFIERLRCPACGHDDFKRTRSTLTCHACRRDYDMEDGVVDLAPPQMRTGGLAQRIMESNFYARFYENVMRPNLTKLVSNRSMREERELAAEYLELDADSTLLDVATGTGNFIRHFAKDVAGEASGYDDRSLAVGMDISWPMLEQARSFLRREGLTDRVFLLRGDATRIPLGRETFSRVHCAGGLHLMDGVVDEALRNFSRVLEPGGRLVVSTFLIDGSFLKQFAKRLAGLATHFHWFSREELHDRLERAGLEVEEESISKEAITLKARRA
jgi:S-adenosylmethionine-diacylgycerolhomoserine-N-methlytransferase